MLCIFHVFFGHMHVFFGEMAIEVFCPFFLFSGLFYIELHELFIYFGD